MENVKDIIYLDFCLFNVCMKIKKTIYSKGCTSKELFKIYNDPSFEKHNYY